MSKAIFVSVSIFTIYVSVLLVSLSSVPAVFAAYPINVAGVYEYDAKPNGVKQMYMTLDFINSTSDITQVFTKKE